VGVACRPRRASSVGIAGTSIAASSQAAEDIALNVIVGQCCDNRGQSAVTSVAGGCENLMNIVEYFEMRKREVEEQLEAIESGRVLRLVCETKTGSVDVTEQEKQRLRQASKDYWRAAENLRRINSSQSLR
jgi:hypothetical protein